MMFHFVNWLSSNVVLKNKMSEAKLIYMILNKISDTGILNNGSRFFQYDSNDKGLWSPPDEELQDGDTSAMILLLLSFFSFF